MKVKEITGQTNGKLPRTISYVRCIKNTFGCVNSGVAAGGWEHHGSRATLSWAVSLASATSWQQQGPVDPCPSSGSALQQSVRPARKWKLMPCSMSAQPSTDVGTNVLQGGHCRRNHLPIAQKQLVQAALAHQRNQTLGCNRRTINKLWVSPSHSNWCYQLLLHIPDWRAHQILRGFFPPHPAGSSCC